MHSLLENQNKLHDEAKALLEEVILPIIKPFGEVLIGGSYAYNLLYQRDIDIDIIIPNLSKEQYTELCTAFIRHPFVSGFKTTNRVNYTSKGSGNNPKGYWVSPQFSFANAVWKIDIWMQKPQWHTGATLSYQEKLAELSEESRIKILALKKEMIDKKIYGHGKEFLSVDVYDAVLEGGAESIEDVRKYNEKKYLEK